MHGVNSVKFTSKKVVIVVVVVVVVVVVLVAEVVAAAAAVIVLIAAVEVAVAASAALGAAVNLMVSFLSCANRTVKALENRKLNRVCSIANSYRGIISTCVV
jgi:hypothetical protein